MHLTVQTERSDGVAAGPGARDRAGAPAPPSCTGAAPSSRWGCQELQAGRPELFQSRGQQAGWSHWPSPFPSHPSLCCVVGCVTSPESRALREHSGRVWNQGDLTGSNPLHAARMGGSTQGEFRKLPAPLVRQASSHL